jgi:thioredoxin-related protein
MTDVFFRRITPGFRFVVMLVSLLIVAVSPAPTFAQEGHPHAVELPSFFVETFMVLPEDAAEAAKTGKRLLLYFGQDGCPYCKELIQTNFTQGAIVDTTKKHFMPMAINLWGDREVTWFDGKVRSEKEFAKFLKVQFTPTVLLLDEKGGIVARINGYYPPHRFLAALDYAAQRLEGKLSFAAHMQAVPQQGASPTLHEQAFFLKAAVGKSLDLRRKTGGKPLAVLFETRHCAACDELHTIGFVRAETRAALAQFDVARFSLSAREMLVTPQGERMSGEAWAQQLKISYTPSVVFFDDIGVEVFRLEAYVRPFHFTSSFEYVGSGGYKQEPEFQRWLQGKAERMKQKGQTLDLWN